MFSVIEAIIRLGERERDWYSILQEAACFLVTNFSFSSSLFSDMSESNALLRVAMALLADVADSDTLNPHETMIQSWYCGPKSESFY